MNFFTVPTATMANAEATPFQQTTQQNVLIREERQQNFVANPNDEIHAYVRAEHDRQQHYFRNVEQQTEQIQGDNFHGQQSRRYPGDFLSCYYHY